MELPFPLRGESAAIRETRRKIETAAKTPWPVLLVGESGVGKQAAAEWLHRLSPRNRHKMVEANTSCWNGNTMILSVLFGHERGAFTGATARHVGLFERAHGGTLFLDEIGDLDLGVQPMLLKALDQGIVEPLGGKAPRKVDTRVIAATNQDLEAAVGEGRFRRDLLARVGTLTIRIPPLRERLEDMPDLWRGLCARRGVRVETPGDLGERIERGEVQDNLRGLERIAIERSVWG
jgi:DNA-binding NtrC family response regulator